MYQEVFFNIEGSLIKTEYLSICIYVMLAIVLSAIIVSMSYFLVIQNPDSEKLSSYECGFEPYEDARHRFLSLIHI